MSEHVLCMVLYLIELGLDNQVQENEDKVRYRLDLCWHGPYAVPCAAASVLVTIATSAHVSGQKGLFGWVRWWRIYEMLSLAIVCWQEPCIEEHCHDSWFPGTNLLSNLHHVINFVRVRVPESAAEVKREAPPSTSSEASAYGQVGRGQITNSSSARARRPFHLLQRVTVSSGILFICLEIRRLYCCWYVKYCHNGFMCDIQISAAVGFVCYRHVTSVWSWWFV